MSKYARRTQVSPERSQQQIHAMLRRYGADGFGTLELDGAAAVIFSFRSLSIRIDAPLPRPDDKNIMLTPSGRRREPHAAREEHDRAIRQVWRILFASIQAKLEAVETGITSMEHEFMPHVVMPDGKTFGQHMLPRLLEAAENNRFPKLGLPGGGGGGEQ